MAYTLQIGKHSEFVFRIEFITTTRSLPPLLPVLKIVPADVDAVAVIIVT
jgi:hypothetical protein